MDDELKALVREHVRAILAEMVRRSPLNEVFSIPRTTRANGDGKSANWVDVEPGEYLLLSVEDRDGTEFVVLKRTADGQILPPLVTRTKRGLTHFGELVWSGF